MSGQPPNGAPREPRAPVMNHQERLVWLASHRAPAYFRLVTTAEMSILEVQLRRAAVYEREFQSTVAELDLDDAPDLTRPPDRSKPEDTNR